MLAMRYQQANLRCTHEKHTVEWLVRAFFIRVESLREDSVGNRVKVSGFLEYQISVFYSTPQ